jgi:LAO/AO transport system kinase
LIKSQLLYQLSYGECGAANLEKYYLSILIIFVKKNIHLADKTEHTRSALKVNKGVEQPSSFNPEAIKHLKTKGRGSHDVREYITGIRSGNIMILSKAITMIESLLPQHQAIAREIVDQCLPWSGKSIRIGITGVPGVGKSTFIEALGTNLTALGHKLAVLAIDPSSERSKGSILGDKTRMEKLAADPNAYIRPSPSAGSLGGVARKTKEIIILCEAAGFDTIFVETVGVGQSETAVHAMVDFFLLLMLAGAGDELQGIKRGIMEMADMIVINKADGDNLLKAQLAKTEYSNAIHLFPPAESGWIPTVGLCSSTSGEGISRVWDVIGKYRSLAEENGYFEKNRMNQNRDHFYHTLQENLLNRFYTNGEMAGLIKRIEQQVISGQLTPFSAAQQLLDKYFKS